MLTSDRKCKMCHEKVFHSDDLEAVKLVLDAISVLSPANVVLLVWKPPIDRTAHIWKTMNN
jgi:hypothetical protein